MLLTKWSAVFLILWLVFPCCASDEGSNRKNALTDVLQVDSPASAAPVLGKPLAWSLALNPEEANNPATIVNTALLEDTIYAADSHNTFHAITRTSGQHRWLLQLRERPLYRPAVNALYVTIATKNTLTVVRRDIGARLYERSIEELSLSGPPAMSSQAIYLPTLVDNSVETMNIADATLGWRYRMPDLIMGQPAVVSAGGERLVVASIDGTVVGLPARRADAGVPRTELWKRNTLGPNSADLAAADNAVILASQDGFVYSIDPSSGERNWSFPGRESFRERPVVARGLVFAANAAGLFAIDLASGRLKWHVSEGRRLIAATADGGAVVELTSSRLAKVNAKGEVLESMNLGDSYAITNNVDEAIYISDAKRIYAFSD